MGHRPNRSLGFAVAAALLITFTALPAEAQIRQAEFKIHDRGELWETMKDNGTIGARNPTNRFEFFPSMDWPGGPHVLPSKDEQRHYSVGTGFWMGGRRDGQLFFTEHGPFSYVDLGQFDPITRVENYVESPDFNPAEAELKITAGFVTEQNVRVERVSRQWSFRPHRTTLLIEYRMTNQNSGPLEDVYFGLPSLLRPSYQDFVVHNGWGDALNRADNFVRFDASRNLVYTWDDTPNFSLPWNVGNYWEDADEMRTTGYAGFALVHADPNLNGSSDPNHVLYAQLLGNERHLTLTSTSERALYDILSGTDTSLQADPEERIVPFILMSIGPYRMEAGSTVRFVIAYGVNGLPISEAVKGLAVQENLPAGRDSLAASIDRARALFQNDHRVTAVPPPSPDVEIVPLPATGSISISWAPLDEGWTNPLGSGASFQEYRVYRSSRSFIGPFQQVARMRPGNNTDRNRFFDASRNVWHFVDNDVSLGTSYYYAVTSIDNRGNESFLTNRNEQPIRVASVPSEDALSVSVFPNPFRIVSGFPTRGEENSIVFRNLPATATIRIYNIAGELVRVIEHDNPNSGEAVWDQLSESRQRTAPGIYAWTVTSNVGVSKGTLVIIK